MECNKNLNGLICCIITAQLTPATSTYQDFKRRTLDSANQAPGSWPYSCQKLIPCPDIPHQTCGCQSPFGTGSLAIVYNLDVKGELQLKT